MRIPFTHGPGTVGREDRLVRGGIALSLLLLVGFAVAMSGRSGPVSIAMILLGLYFTLTAALGRDPFYAHFEIDTRTDAELASTSGDPDAWSGEPAHILDLREPHRADDHHGNSPLGR
jgi:hypothetical protein